MAEASDARGILAENLLDAGCGEELIRQVEALMAAGRKRECLELLTRRRWQLLECCHAEQKRLDCMDYLIYKLEKDKKGEETHDL